MRDNQDSSNSEVIDPTAILQEAVEQIDVFSEPLVSRFEVEENGRLFSVKANGLKKIVNIACNFVGPIFSHQLRQEQEKKLSQIKQGLLQARDTIQSHSQLIEKLKKGTPAQQKLAQSILDAIQRYNAVVIQDPDTSWTKKYDFYNYERNQLLLDEEIKGKEIRIPHTISIQYDAPTDNHPGQKTIKRFSDTFFLNNTQKKSITTTHKKSMQVMLDAFKMKAIRNIQQYLLPHSMGEVVELLKHTPVEINEQLIEDSILMRQVIDISPGSTIILSGSFRKIEADSRLMSIPILQEFHSSLQSTQTGFPLPSQYAAWALTDQLVNADPLRIEQVPLFAMIDSKKKKIIQNLLFDKALINKSKHIFKQNKDAFNRNIHQTIELHRELIETILTQAPVHSFIKQDASHVILEEFYDYVKSGLSNLTPFDQLALTQLQIINLAIIRPFQKLQEEWLSGFSGLRQGSCQEKRQVACKLLKTELERGLVEMDTLIDTNGQKDPIYPFIRLLSQVYGQVSRSIIMQHMSEKIGFAPPMLTDFEQKMQTCAFQQLVTFLDELEKEYQDNYDWQSHVEAKLKADLAIFAVDTIDEIVHLPADLTQELEVYFNSRFYATNSNSR